MTSLKDSVKKVFNLKTSIFKEKKKRCVNDFVTTVLKRLQVILLKKHGNFMVIKE